MMSFVDEMEQLIENSEFWDFWQVASELLRKANFIDLKSKHHLSQTHTDVLNTVIRHNAPIIPAINVVHFSY